MAPVRVSVVIASTRPTRIGHHVAAWVVEALDGFGAADGRAVEVTVHDLREIGLPFLDEPGQPADGNYAHDHTRRWSAAMSATDALVLVMPEYNRGYNAALKNAIDYLYAEWEGLPVGLVGYGWHGASFAKSALRQTLERVRMTVVDGPGLSFEDTLTQTGEVRADDAAQAALDTMLTELVATARS